MHLEHAGADIFGPAPLFLSSRANADLSTGAIKLLVLANKSSLLGSHPPINRAWGLRALDIHHCCDPGAVFEAQTVSREARMKARPTDPKSAAVGNGVIRSRNKVFC